MSRVLGAAERSPEGVLLGEVEGAGDDAVGDDRVHEVAQGQLPAPTLLRIVAGHRGHQLGHRGAVAAQQPEDARRATHRQRADRCGLVDERRHRRPAPGHRGVTVGGDALIAIGRGLAGGDAGRLGGLGGDAGRVGLDGEAFELEGQDPRGLALARDRRRGLARLAVDPVDLEQPGAGGALDGLGRRRCRAVLAEGDLRRVLGGADGAWVRGGRRRIGARLMVVVRALGGAQRLLGRTGLGPGPGGQLAALVGDAPQVGAGSGVDSGIRRDRGGRRRRARPAARRSRPAHRAGRGGRRSTPVRCGAWRGRPPPRSRAGP